MLESIKSFVAGVIRPVTCIMLTLAFIAAVLSPLAGASLDVATFMAAALGAPDGMVLMYYFKERSEKAAREA